MKPNLRNRFRDRNLLVFMGRRNLIYLNYPLRDLTMTTGNNRLKGSTPTQLLDNENDSLLPTLRLLLGTLFVKPKGTTTKKGNSSFVNSGLHYFLSRILRLVHLKGNRMGASPSNELYNKNSTLRRLRARSFLRLTRNLLPYPVARGSLLPYLRPRRLNINRIRPNRDRVLQGRNLFFCGGARRVPFLPIFLDMTRVKRDYGIFLGGLPDSTSTNETWCTLPST